MPVRWLRSKSLQAMNAEEGVEEREPSYTVGGNANYGEQCGDSFKNWKLTCFLKGDAAWQSAADCGS